MKKSKKMLDVAVPYVEKPNANVRLGKSMKLPSLKIGKKITVEITGKITNLSDDEYSRGFSMQITGIETEDDSMGSDLNDMRAKRRY